MFRSLRNIRRKSLGAKDNGLDGSEDGLEHERCRSKSSRSLSRNRKSISDSSPVSERRLSRRSSIQNMMKRLSMGSRGSSTEELERELSSLRRKSQQEISRTWAEVERLENEKIALQERCSDLEKRLDKELNLRSENDSSAMNMSLGSLMNNSTTSFSENMKMDSYRSLVDCEIDSEGNIGVGRTKGLFVRGSRKDISKDVDRNSSVESMYTTMILELEQKLKARDAEIETLEDTIALQQITWANVHETNDDQGDTQNIESQKDKKIKELEIKIISLNKELKEKDRDTKKNVADLQKKIDRRANEIRCLTSSLTKQKKYIHTLKLKIKSFKNEDQIHTSDVLGVPKFISDQDETNS